MQSVIRDGETNDFTVAGPAARRNRNAERICRGNLIQLFPVDSGPGLQLLRIRRVHIRQRPNGDDRIATKVLIDGRPKLIDPLCVWRIFGGGQEFDRGDGGELAAD